ncbi:MAG: hypothetical protein QNJ64_10860 [Crocosphaera sp.]|nr:hypothetical protein [Crocosphaera sp.]
MSDRNRANWEEKLEQKFQDLEAEVNRQTTPVRPFNPNEETQRILSPVATWYQGLHTPAKVGVAIVGFIAGLYILNSILKLVTSVIVVGILGAVLYGLYRALIKDKSSS